LVSAVYALHGKPSNAISLPLFLYFQAKPDKTNTTCIGGDENCRDEVSLYALATDAGVMTGSIDNNFSAR
jgi:hypothetical protein